MIDREQIIRLASEWHTREPFDAGHDWNHHQEVINNCLWIIKEENLEGKVNVGFILAAAAWHDFRRGEDDYSVMESELERLGATEEEVHSIINIISSHSFGQDQSSLEAKVLFDADKLAYVSTDRIDKVLRAVEEGEMPAEKMSRYAYHFRQRIPQIPDLLHFDCSRSRFSADLESFRAHVSEVKELQEFML